MAEGPAGGADDSIGGLFGRLVADGRSYAEAELALFKAVAKHRAVKARKAMVALAIGWFFLVTAMTAMLLGLVLSLAARFGPMWAGLIVGIPLIVGGYALVRYGWARVKMLGGDAEERAAIAAAEAEL